MVYRVLKGPTITLARVIFVDVTPILRLGDNGFEMLQGRLLIEDARYLKHFLIQEGIWAVIVIQITVLLIIRKQT